MLLLFAGRDTVQPVILLLIEGVPHLILMVTAPASRDIGEGKIGCVFSAPRISVAQQVRGSCIPGNKAAYSGSALFGGLGAHSSSSASGLGATLAQLTAMIIYTPILHSLGVRSHIRLVPCHTIFQAWPTIGPK